MAKKGMSRPQPDHSAHSGAPVVPQLQGKSKRAKAKAAPMIPGTDGPNQKVFHP